jgi:hypothetical protein
MEDARRALTRSKTPLPLSIAQSVVALSLAWIAVRSLLELQKDPAAFTTTPLFWLSIAGLVIVAIAHSPPVFFRGSTYSRYAIYSAAIIALFAVGIHEKDTSRSGNGAPKHREGTSHD